ncbi:MAG: hypothetical protein JJ855_09590 [Rhodospirillales bacterium]|nr:hypothetical protein [Rhodospirillales bacterium]
MTELTIALGVLALTHLMPSAPGVRPACIRALGLLGFRIVYSVISLVVVAWLITAYIDSADTPWVWTPPFWTRWIAVFAMPLAMWLIAVRLIQKPDHARNRIYRLIPAPGSCGLLLWASLHLLNVGQARSVLLFGAFAAISGVAMIKNTMAARSLAGWRSIGPLWDWRPPFAAVLMWLLFLALHPYLFDVDPLAGILH